MPSKGYLDAPANGATLTGTATVSGWFLDGSGVAKVEVLVDGTSVGQAVYGSQRLDVNNAYPDYQNTNSGYQYALNTKTLSNGQHSLTVKETGNNGTTNVLDSIKVNVQNLSAIGYVDAPASGSTLTGTTTVSGWFLDASGVAKIEVLVDGTSVGQAVYGSQRLDVKSAFPDYQNANSGYQYSLNTTALSDGQHSLTVRETGNNGTATVLDSATVNVQNSKAKGYLDAPANGSTLQGTTTVSGWFLDASGVAKVEVLIDGKAIGQAVYGSQRLDVKSAFPEYQNANSGYQYTLDTTTLSSGQHSLTIRETGKDGAVHMLDGVQVNVQGLSAKGYLDAPANGSTIKGTATVSGWFLDASGVAKIEVLVDGKSMGQATYGSSRLDVNNAFPEYKNANSGYSYALNTKTLSNGQHSLTIRETGANGTVTVLDGVQVNVQNPLPKGIIDTPVNGAAIKENVAVSGWFLDANGVAKIEVLVDGKSVGQASYGTSRLDVYNAFPEYKNANSGFQYTLNTKSLINGQHSLTVRETGNDGTVTVLGSTQVNVQNLPTQGYIDTPSSSAPLNGDVTVKGWLLDVSGVNEIDVFVDGINMGQASYGISRSDVYNAFPEYQNTNSGYQYTFSSQSFAEGQHTLTVKETGGNGATYTVSTQIYIYNDNPYKYVDLRKPANITADDIVNFFNRTHPDSPLKNDAQYFIDAQNKYGVNAQYLVAHAIWETGWGGSALITYKHNLFGYGAYNVCPFTCGYYFPADGDSINFEAYVVRRDYLDSTGSYYNGSNLAGMNVRYATDPNWSAGIAGVMQSIKSYDAGYYLQTNALPTSATAVAAPVRNIPAGQPYPTDIVINNTTDTYATVMATGVTFRTLPYLSSSTLISSLSQGKVVKVLGYNTDVKYVPGDISQYPYDNRWYRVLVDGQEGWIYGGGIVFNP